MGFPFFSALAELMTIPNSLAGYDVPGAVGRMLDQPTLWWEALGLFVSHFADWAESWQLSIGDDALEMKRVHAIGSAAANVGAYRLEAAARTLEAVLRQRLGGTTLAIADSLRATLLAAYSEAWSAASSARLGDDCRGGQE